MTTADVAMRAYSDDAMSLRLAARVHYRAGESEEAQLCLRWADRVDRARSAELTDPEPQDPPWCVCQTCQAHLFNVHWRKLA